MPRTASMTHGRTRHSARGAVLIVALFVVTALVGLVLVLARDKRVDAMAAAHERACAQARAIALGAAQAVLTLGDSLPADVVEVGDGAFWLLSPDFDDDKNAAFGIADEASKVDINTASVDTLMMLPGVDEALAAAIVDWRDEDSTPSTNGAENEVYLLCSPPYYAKNAPFESVEELLFVRGMTPEILYGEDWNRNGVLEANENDGAESDPPDNADGKLDRGLVAFVTIYSQKEAEGLVNVNGSEGGAGGGGGGAGGGAGGAGGADAGDTGGDQSEAQIKQALQTAVSAGTLSESRADQLVQSIVSSRPYTNLIDMLLKTGMTVEEFNAVAGQLTTSSNQTQAGSLINVNGAAKEVLMTLPGITESDAEAMISYRVSVRASSTSSASTGANAASGTQSSTATNPRLAGIGWVTEALSREKAVAIGNSITVASTQRCADIVAVSGDGRAFERYRMVYDASSSTPRIVLWQRLTHLGWPLDARIPAMLKAGTRLAELPRTTERGVF